MPTTFATPEKFVRVWQTSNNIVEVAKELNRNPNTVSTRAKLYRNKGIPLKKFVGGPRIGLLKNTKFGKRTSSGITGKHRSRKGLTIFPVNVKALKKLAKSLV